MKLSDQDGQAVDTVLNAAEIAHGGTSGLTAFGGVDLAGRVTKVDFMLKLLDHLPAEDPSPTLVEATMRRVREQSGRAATQAGETLPLPAAAGEAARPAVAGESLHLSPSPGGNDNPGIS